MLDEAGHIGSEVGEVRFNIGKIEPAGDVLRDIAKDHRQIGRQRAENLA